MDGSHFLAGRHRFSPLHPLAALCRFRIDVVRADRILAAFLSHLGRPNARRPQPGLAVGKRGQRLDIFAMRLVVPGKGRAGLRLARRNEPLASRRGGALQPRRRFRQPAGRLHGSRHICVVTAGIVWAPRPAGEGSKGRRGENGRPAPFLPFSPSRLHSLSPRRWPLAGSAARIQQRANGKRRVRASCRSSSPGCRW